MTRPSTRSPTPQAASPATDPRLTYEQPLNERIRGFLRLESLFDQFRERVQGLSEWDSRAGLERLIELTEILGRSDFKGDVIKELDRQSAALSRLQSNPGVDGQRLDEVLNGINTIAASLKDPNYQPGQTVRQDELVTAVRQRLAIPGGTCSFDLPALHFWLKRPVAKRNRQLEHWFADLQVISEGISLALKILRDSSYPVQCTARGGFYQQSLENNSCSQLLRVRISAAEGLFPEISASRHRFTVRFLEQSDTAMRASQTTRDIGFDLQCCVL
ncbi:MAG: cell division protein ZapD [Gammaproteobacteria bacterium]